MLNAKFALLFLAMVSSTGCVRVVSLHPMVEADDKDAVFVPALVGTWQATDPNSDDTLYVVTHDDSGYTVIVKPGPDNAAKGDKEMKLAMQVLAARGEYLLDIDWPSDGPPVPVHMFCKLRLERDSAWVSMMDTDWLRQQIKTNVLLRHEDPSGDHEKVLLTGSPGELRSFLLPYFYDSRSFDDEGELRRVK